MILDRNASRADASHVGGRDRDLPAKARVRPHVFQVAALRQLVEEGDPDLASKATSLASVIDAAGSVEVVDKAARSSDPVIRVAAAAALGNLSEMPGPLAQGMLNDEDVGVRKLNWPSDLWKGNNRLASNKGRSKWLRMTLIRC
jgi:hypothetical protein